MAVALILCVTRGQRLLAWFAVAAYVPHNAQLEGARILAHRSAIQTAGTPTGVDVLLIGSSRTMADCSADIVADGLAEYWGIESGLMGRNLGSAGSDFRALANRLENGPVPRLLVLEFSPHMLGQIFYGAEPDTQGDLGFAAYRRHVALAELYVSGWTRRLLGVEGMLRIRPEDVPDIWRSLTMSPKTDTALVSLYYLLRSADGYAQQLRPDGQVYYYSYLPNRRAADRHKRVNRLRGGFNYELLTEEVNQDQIEGLRMVVNAVRRRDGKMVVWRPPVDPELYAFESQHMAGGIAAVCALLAEIGVPYIDTNPHSYSTSDLSHVDWFDTARLSRELAARSADALVSGEHHAGISAN